MNLPEWQSRTELLLGTEALSKLANSHVLILGLGGVGAYTAEMLCRAGVGHMTIVDGDAVQPSNINRQLIAMESTIGLEKAKVLADRLRDINPLIKLDLISEYQNEDNMDSLLTFKYDYVADAIDTLSPKVAFIQKTMKKGYPLVSSMGAGGKLDPSKVMVSDVEKSFNCRLAHSMRKKLHKLGIYKGFKVVFSPEEVSKDSVSLVQDERNKRSNVGTISYMPAVFGCFMASVILRDLTSERKK
ncbi:MAG: tRNA threonylcarbamoyladenosine dehydratase [Bacteroidales bacterium]|nr:tRNA threonylcarbamoyladenosine dehydratase [Bacteroidales bacterium]